MLILDQVTESEISGTFILVMRDAKGNEISVTGLFLVKLRW